MFFSTARIKAMLKLASTDATRPKLNGINVDDDGSTWATDGHMAIRIMPMLSDVKIPQVSKVYNDAIALPVTERLKINVRFLRDICDTIITMSGSPKKFDTQMTLTMHGSDNAIDFKAKIFSDEDEIVGLLMPCRLPEEL